MYIAFGQMLHMMYVCGKYPCVIGTPSSNFWLVVKVRQVGINFSVCPSVHFNGLLGGVMPFALWSSCSLFPGRGLARLVDG